MAFLDKMVLQCCGNCQNRQGTSMADYYRNERQNSSRKNTKYEMKEAIDDLTDLSFPVHGYSDQRNYLRNYKYVPVVESPGAAFIVRNEGLQAPVTAALAVSWPLAVIVILFIFLSGFLFWMAVSVKVKLSCLGSKALWVLHLFHKIISLSKTSSKARQKVQWDPRFGLLPLKGKDWKWRNFWKAWNDQHGNSCPKQPRLLFPTRNKIHFNIDNTSLGIISIVT